MVVKKVAINGFGSIGRRVLRLLIGNAEFEVVAINDLNEPRALAHLFKYDSIHGKYIGNVEVLDGNMVIDELEIPVYSKQNPSELPWSELGVDYVLECSGAFKTEEALSLHLSAGASKVLLSVPPQDDAVKTVVLGVNEDILAASDKIISNASCTTNSAAPLVKEIQKLSPIETGYITTVHSYTTDQKLHDVPHRDLRRARAAALSIVPTTTGAAKAITKIFPDLEGKLGGCGIRVPVPDGSLTDMTFILKDELTTESVNAHFKNAAENGLKGILEYTSDPIVSVDVIGNTASSIFDSELTSVMGKMVKVVAWYDNETGYSSRLVDLLHYVDSLES